MEQIDLVGRMLAERGKWVATWGAAPFRMEEEHRPCAPALNGSTLRQILRISLGGETFRFTLSNEYGAEPLEIERVMVAGAAQAGNSGVLPETGVLLCFRGEARVTLAPGETVTSDPVTFACGHGGDMAVSIVFGESIPETLTGHSFANATCWIASGDRAESAIMPEGERRSCRYFLTGVSVLSEENAWALVCCGDSITDGVGAEENRFNDWPNVLSGHLRTDERLAHVSVVNAGIGGNKFATPDCVGPSGL